MAVKQIAVQSTKDYSQFKTLLGNRVVNEKHVQEIMESMKQELCIDPIQVNEHLQVIDGQHRLEAHKRLKEPIYYYIVKGAKLSNVQRMNTHSLSWKHGDYLQSYISQGLKDYKIYKEYQDTYKFPYKVTLMLLLNMSTVSGTQVTRTFENGTFKIVNLERAVEIGNMLSRVEPYYEGFLKTGWLHAIVRAINLCPKFNFEVFMHKLKRQSRKLVDCANIPQYIDLIEEIYNDKCRKDNRIDLKPLRKIK